MKRKEIVCWGNPADGFQFFGPFDSMEEAEKWAKKKFAYQQVVKDGVVVQNNEWSYATLQPKSDYPVY